MADIQGRQGLQGHQGTQGRQGTQGIQGLRGFNGLFGAQGIQGGQGLQGQEGAQGNTGQGIQGPRGFIGTDGPAFIATITTPQAIAPTLPQNVLLGIPGQINLIYNAISKNIGNGYNSSTGIFTCPTSGFYQVSASLAPASPAPTNLSSVYGEGAVVIHKNSQPIAAGKFIAARIARGFGWIIDGSSISSLIYLDVGDTLQARLWYFTNLASFTTLANIVPNYFQAVWIRS